jgi:hypothetical protein
MKWVGPYFRAAKSASRTVQKCDKTSKLFHRVEGKFYIVAGEGSLIKGNPIVLPAGTIFAR